MRLSYNFEEITLFVQLTLTDQLAGVNVSSTMWKPTCWRLFCWDLFMLFEPWIDPHFLSSLSLLCDRRNVDIVVVRAMADKRKLQGKTVCETHQLCCTRSITFASCTENNGIFIIFCFLFMNYLWCCIGLSIIILDCIFYFFTFTSTGEIDRCLKKVSEGVEQFEDIWQKVRELCFCRCICLILYFKTYVVKLMPFYASTI